MSNMPEVAAAPQSPIAESEDKTINSLKPVSAHSDASLLSQEESLANLINNLKLAGEENLPPPEIVRRVNALKKIQVEVAQVESAFFKEMHVLEMKYADRYKGYFEKRKDIISGSYEPSEVECDLSEFQGEKEKKPEEATPEENQEKVNGIPNFWLTIFQNVETLSEMVKDYDLPILKELTDIKVEMTKDPIGFQLFFHFSPNDFFTNSVLTKTYEMKYDIDLQDPFSYEGPEIVKCTGCTVDWKEGKNVTVRVVHKKQKHKQSGAIRTVTKTEDVESFFSFFTPPQIPTGEEEMDDEIQEKLTADFEVGQYIRERIIPRAVLYFTGEAMEDFSDLDEEEEEEEEEESTTDGTGNSDADGPEEIEGDDD